MAQSTTALDTTFFVPGSYVKQVVQASNSGLSTTGVLMLVGEADTGPDASVDDITANFYGPDELAAVQKKYTSGSLVDAFKVAVAAANDPNIQGAFSRAYLAKSNVSLKSSGAFARAGLASSWATAADKNWGVSGNSINVQVISSAAEVAPTTGAFTYIPTPSTSTLSLRVNGGATQNVSITAKMPPSSLVTSLNALTVGGLADVWATGGVNRTTIQVGLVGTNIALAVSGNDVVITLGSGSWSVTPSAGDTLIIPNSGDYGAASNSVLAGAGNANRGAYVVTAATSSSVSATKLRNDVAGGLVAPVAVSSTPISVITDIICYSPVTATNSTGIERSILVSGLVGQTVAGTASGTTLTLTLQTGAQWNALPQANDMLLISSTAPAAWLASGANTGWYTVVSSTTGTGAGASTITLTRVSNGNPASFVATAIAAVTDFRVLRPAIDGVGKALEVFDGGGTESITTQLYNLSTTAVSWVSAAGALAKILLSASEYVAEIDVARLSDSVSEQIVGAGDVLLRVGYHGGGVLGVTGTMTISGTTLTTSVSGGNGSNLSIDLKQFKTLSDLASLINSQTGYTASVGSALFGQFPLNYKDTNNVPQVVLDKATWGIASHNITAVSTVSPAGRVKRDAFALAQKIANNSILIQLGTNLFVVPSAGQPDVQALFFLNGGAKGASTNARVTAAIDKMEKVRGNFLITLFSRDAADDIADGLTDSASTYTIDSINSYVRSHVLALSQIKRRRNRQGFASKETSFLNAKLAAQNLASARCALAFQDVKDNNSAGSLTQFQPWMTAVHAAATQAAAFYKPIVHKFLNCSGILMKDGSFSDQSFSQLEDALQNGLLVVEQAPNGGFRWVSDQTTYGVDNNFVYNSIQAVYIADVIALTLAQRMEDAFVGQSLADVGAGIMLSYLAAVMVDFKKLKLIAASDDAPAGYKNAVIKINGNAAEISLEVKEATGLYFIPITLGISQITQTASL